MLNIQILYIIEKYTCKQIHTTPGMYNIKQNSSVCCASIKFSYSLIFPSRAGVIDDLDMDDLYRTVQSVPRPTTTSSEADQIKAMTAVFENLCANHAKYTTTDGAINYEDKDIPSEVCDWCLLHNNPNE